MKCLWLWYFPLLYLPNLGLSRPTPFGVLQLSDFLIGPYLVLLLFAVRRGDKRSVGRLTPIFGAFVVWAALSTLTIPGRYDYQGYGPMQFCLLKLAKLSLYGLAGILTARALTDDRARRRFEWALLAAGVTVGVSLFLIGTTHGSQRADGGYSAANGISVMVAVLLCYLAARMLTGQNSDRWRRFTKYGLVAMTVGFVLSDGRGGWVAAIAGCAYLLIRLGPSRKTVWFITATVVAIAILYNTQSDFQKQVDETLFAPQTTSGYQGTRNVGGLDDGGRFENWSREAPKLLSAPLLGTGFFHRGGNSGLSPTGSHNFFIQMFLETGVVGGLAVIGIIIYMWKQATAVRKNLAMNDVPLKAAVVAAVIGGLSGEYFYGGIILFTLLSVYAPTGSQPWGIRRDVAEAQWRAAPPVPGRSAAAVRAWVATPRASRPLRHRPDQVEGSPR